MRILVIALPIVLFLGLLFSTPIIHYSTMETIQNVQIDDKYVKRRDGDDLYMVVIEHEDGKKEVLQNTDSFLSWKWGSADYQADLEVGSTCDRMVVNNWRVQFLSWNRNIISLEDC